MRYNKKVLIIQWFISGSSQAKLFFWSRRIITQAASRREMSPEGPSQLLNLVITTMRAKFFNPPKKVWRCQRPVRHFSFFSWFSCEQRERGEKTQTQRIWKRYWSLIYSMLWFAAFSLYALNHPFQIHFCNTLQ